MILFRFVYNLKRVLRQLLLKKLCTYSYYYEWSREFTMSMSLEIKCLGWMMGREKCYFRTFIKIITVVVFVISVPLSVV